MKLLNFKVDIIDDMKSNWWYEVQANSFFIKLFRGEVVMGYCVINISDLNPEGIFFCHFLVVNKWGGVLVTKSDKEERSKGS